MNFFYYDSELNVYPTQLDAVASGRSCWFYYYDKEMALVDWKIDPPEHLDALYKKRAEYIRDQYKYVILCYSGGHDSTNMLETFYYNNIHIDEILIVGAFSQDREYGSDYNHNGELYKNAFPTLRGMNLPNTKITIADYTKWFNNPNNFSAITQYGNEWTKHIGGFKSVHTLFWRDLKKFIGHSNSKETAYIMGTDKVKLSFEIDKPSYVFFSDMSFLDYGTNYKDENFTRVNFYTDVHPTATDITRKQAHLVNRFKKTYANSLDKIPTGDALLNKLLYKLRHPLIYLSPKSQLSSLSERDKFMLDSQNSDMYKMMIEGWATINKYGSSTQKYNFQSRPYYIE